MVHLFCKTIHFLNMIESGLFIFCGINLGHDFVIREKKKKVVPATPPVENHR